MTEHNNPPAFPVKNPLSNDFLGLTMLDHFAGLAMQGMLADFPLILSGPEWQEKLSANAYKVADAMLKERAKWIK